MLGGLLNGIHPRQWRHWCRWMPEALLLVLFGILYTLRISTLAVTTTTEWRWLAELTGLYDAHFFQLTKGLVATVMVLNDIPLEGARLVMAVLGLAVLCLTYGGLRTLHWSRAHAVLATLVPATTLGVFQLTRTLNPELPLLAGTLALLLLAHGWWHHRPAIMPKPLRRLHPLSGWLGMIFAGAGFELGAPGLLLLAVAGGLLVWRKPGVTNEERLAFALGFVVALGMLFVFLGDTPLWPVLSLPDLSWKSLLIASWQGIVQLFPWGLIALAAGVEVLTGAHRQGVYRAGHRLHRPGSLGWTLVLAGAWLALAGALLLIGQTPTLPWLMLLAAPMLALHHYLAIAGRDQAHSLFKLSFDGTALCLCLLGVMLSWWLFFELPDTYPSTAWLLPGNPSYILPLQQLISDSLSNVPIPVWKYWFIPVPMLLLLGAACLILLHKSSHRATLSVGLMSWSVLWFLYLGAVAQPLLWPEVTRNVLRYLPASHALDSPSPAAQVELERQPDWRLWPHLANGYPVWCAETPDGDAVVLVPEPAYYQCSVGRRDQWWVRRYLEQRPWPDGALSLLMIVGGTPRGAQVHPDKRPSLLVVSPVPLADLNLPEPEVETIPTMDLTINAE